MSIVKTGWYSGNQLPTRSGYYLRDHSKHNRGNRGIKLSYFDAETGRWGRYQSSNVVPGKKRGFRSQPQGSVWQRVKWCGEYRDANIPDTIEITTTL